MPEPALLQVDRQEGTHQCSQAVLLSVMFTHTFTTLTVYAGHQQAASALQVGGKLIRD